ncbi:MAG: glycosyltransferase family 4 protein [Acidimicrobiia bacterium]
MRVAVVCPYDLGLAGGVQQLTIELVDRLGRSGHDAWLVGPGHLAGARSVGSTVRIRANASSVPVALGPKVGKRVRTALTGADVVHIHEPLIPHVSWAALRTSIPKVLTFHADAPGWARALYRTLDRPIGHVMRSSVVTAVSPVAAASVPPRWGPVDVIPNALDVAAYAQDRERTESRVTFLGRDDPRKGLDVLLGAWPAVRAADPRAELVVIGGVRPEAPEGVRFVGRVDESTKRDLLASTTVHVAPNTRGESFGIVVVEAMAAGAAVIASDIPAFVDVMGGTGVHVPAGDSPALAAAIVDLLGDRARVAAVGEAGRRRAQEFDWSKVTERYVSAYARAVG